MYLEVMFSTWAVKGCQPRDMIDNGHNLYNQA